MGERVCVVRLKGGLGNQLFQYAAGLGISIRNGVPLSIDAFSGFAVDPYRRQYQLYPFNVSATLLSVDQCNKFMAVNQTTRMYLKIREKARQSWLGKNLDPHVRNLKVGASLVLDGYWQSEGFFSDVEDVVRRELALTVPLSKRSQAISEEIASSRNSVSIHIRAMHAVSVTGDLVGKRKPLRLGADYYLKALQHLESVAGPVTAFVFSDNVEEARKIRLSCSMRFIESDNYVPDYEDLYLMGKCDHHIIANSSFSWWGAWFGKRSGITCAPRQFIPFENMAVPQDAYPTEWTVIEEHRS